MDRYWYGSKKSHYMSYEELKRLYARTKLTAIFEEAKRLKAYSRKYRTTKGHHAGNHAMRVYRVYRNRGGKRKLYT